jgi:hypothetical protein
MRRYDDPKESWFLRLLDNDVFCAICQVILIVGIIWFGWWYDGYRMARNARILHENGVGVTAPEGNK